MYDALKVMMLINIKDLYVYVEYHSLFLWCN